MSASPRRALGAGAALAVLLLLAVVGATWPDAPRGEVVRLDLSALGGGWSGVDVDAAGARVVLLSDRGLLLTGRLVREDGRLVALAPDPGGAFALDLGGEVVDAEGLDAFGADGQILVSFEGFARLRRFPRADPRARWGWVVDLPVGVRLRANAGLEALARDAEGRAFTLAERPPPDAGAFELLRFAPVPHWHTGTWSLAARVTHDRGWAAVGADFGPDGAFHLLERRFFGPAFASRIRRFDLRAGDAATPRAGHVLWASRPGAFGNLEGLALWRDAAGGTRAVMVSDDNARAWARGEIVEVVLPAPGALAPATPTQ